MTKIKILALFIAAILIVVIIIIRYEQVNQPAKNFSFQTTTWEKENTLQANNGLSLKINKISTYTSDMEDDRTINGKIHYMTGYKLLISLTNTTKYPIEISFQDFYLSNPNFATSISSIDPVNKNEKLEFGTRTILLAKKKQTYEIMAPLLPSFNINRYKEIYFNYKTKDAKKNKLHAYTTKIS